jgi:hypothetical protein
VLDGRRAQQFERLRTAQREVRELAERNELDRDTADRVVGQFERRITDQRDTPTVRPARPQARPVETHVVAAEVTTRPVPVAKPVAADDTRPVANYEEFLTVEPTPPPVAEPGPVPDAGPRRGVLTRFMEDRNILVGELVGGVLIVGCSVALVLTLWRNLESLPYFPFLLSSAITGALFAAGYYTLHHWKLASTSRGLLIISLLLAPLTLLVLANPGTGAIGGWVDVGVGFAAAIGFAAMVRGAGRLESPRCIGCIHAHRVGT